MEKGNTEQMNEKGKKNEETQRSSNVINFFDNFTGLTCKQMLDVVLKNAKLEDPLINIEGEIMKISEISQEKHYETAKKLITIGQEKTVAEHYDKFFGISTKDSRHIWIEILQKKGNVASLYVNHNLQNLKVGEREIGNVEEVLPAIFKNQGVDLENLFARGVQGRIEQQIILEKEFDREIQNITQRDINKVRALDIVMTRVKKKLMHEEIERRNGTCSKEELIKHVEAYVSKLTKKFSDYMKEILSEDLYEKYAELRGCESEYFVKSI